MNKTFCFIVSNKCYLCLFTLGWDFQISDEDRNTVNLSLEVSDDGV